MASEDLSRIVDRVTGSSVEDIDLEFVGRLAVDPESALEEYQGLTAEERQAIIDRDSSALQRAGLSESSSSGVLSGAHTPTCPT